MISSQRIQEVQFTPDKPPPLSGNLDLIKPVPGGGNGITLLFFFQWTISSEAEVCLIIDEAGAGRL